jgi:hypothetical protein
MDSSDEVLIVAAKRAWHEYLACSAYICQAQRGFRFTSHMAFYCDGFIEALVPRILDVVENVHLSAEGIHADASLSDELKAQLQGVVRALSSMPGQQHLGKRQKVVFLSGKNSPDTIQLAQRIPNDKRDKNGSISAFVYGQRYAPLEKLRANPSGTSQLG